jgi:hypothetical protein
VALATALDSALLLVSQPPIVKPASALNIAPAAKPPIAA